MIRDNHALEAEYGEYFTFLYQTVSYKYRDCAEIDEVVQETMLAFLQKKQAGDVIEHPKGLLCAILQNKYNAHLRKKYANRTVSYEFLDSVEAEDELSLREEEATKREEYEVIRREIGQLIRIYREVTVRHYVHGHSVDKIAAALNIPRGTVLSRLSGARAQIKEGIKDMEKYTSASYEPKRVNLSIWGSDSMAGEPFSLLRTGIEQNVLVLAYEKPVSVREIAGAIGVPCAYLEPMIENLIEGELMGKTPSGLVYTRCFLLNSNERFGDISAQEALANRMAEEVWRIAWKHFGPLTKREEYLAMSEKQKATLFLAMLNGALSGVAYACTKTPKDRPTVPPERPRGGRWLATGLVYEHGESLHPKYEVSGPVQVGGRKLGYQLFDCQSVFGDAHYAYGRMKYPFRYGEILQFYASLLPCNVTVEDTRIYELVPEFEKLCIVKHDSEGELQLDIPALTFDELETYWIPAKEATKKELLTCVGEDLRTIALASRRSVPMHVDYRELYEYDGALSAYPRAQLLSIVEKGLLPYSVTVGKTPLIYLAYRQTEK